MLRAWGKACKEKMKEYDISYSDIAEILTGNKKSRSAIQRNFDAEGHPARGRFTSLCTLLKLNPADFPGACYNVERTGRRGSTPDRKLTQSWPEMQKGLTKPEVMNTTPEYREILREAKGENGEEQSLLARVEHLEKSNDLADAVLKLVEELNRVKKWVGVPSQLK
jgi:hypothetical protein